MNFDKNTVIGIALIVLIYFGFVVYTNKEKADYEKAHPKTAATAQHDSIAATAKDTLQAASNSKPTGSDSAKSTVAGTFGAFASGIEKTIDIENDNCIFTFSNKGGVIKKVNLKKYKTFSKQPLILFDDNGNGFNIEFNAQGNPVQTEQLYFESNNASQVVTGDGKTEIIYTLNLGNGKTYQHKYTVYAKGYVADFELIANNLGSELGNTKQLTLDWAQNYPSQERGIDDQRYNSGVYFMNDKEEDDSYTSDKDKTIEEPLKWISYKQKFFNSSLITVKDNFGANTQLNIVTPKDSQTIIKEVKSKLFIPVKNPNAISFPVKMFLGPNKYNDLKKLDVNLTQIIPLGWSILSLINKYFIIPIFHFLSKFISNYGIIILLLAVIIKLITFPFTYKSSMSMAKMKVLKPELEELKKKYPNQAEYGQKQMELYAQTGVSPFGGCLPMLLQMPILIAMYRFFPASIEMRQQSFLWAQDLTSYDSIFSWTTHIPVISSLLGNHISLFTILMAVSSIAVTKLTQQTQPMSGGGGGGGMEDMMAQQMKLMQYFMPIMLLFIFNKQPAALSYYYFLFNVLTVGQNWILQKFFIDEDSIKAKIEAYRKQPKKTSSFQQKMQDMMKQQQELKKGK